MYTLELHVATQTTQSLGCMKFSLEIMQVDKIKAATQCLASDDDHPRSEPLAIHGDMVTQTVTYPIEDRAAADGLTLDITDDKIDVQVYVDYSGRVGTPTIQIRKIPDEVDERSREVVQEQFIMPAQVDYTSSKAQLKLLYAGLDKGTYSLRLAQPGKPK